MDKTKHNGMLAAFLFYCLAIFFIAFIGAREIGEFSIDESLQHYANVIPFATIAEYVSRFAAGEIGIFNLLLNTLGHIVLMIPMGFLLPALFSRMRNLCAATVTGCAVTFVLEFFQMVLKLGSFDIDSIILRGIGTAIGYLIWRRVTKE